MHHWITLLVLSGLCLSLLPDEASARERQRRLWFRNQPPIFLMPPPPRYQRFYLYGTPEQYDPYMEGYEDPPYEPEPRQKPKKKQKATVKKSEPDAKALTTPSPAPAKSPQVSCAKGQAIVEDFGFKEVKPASCTGQIYAFRAMRDGKAYAVKLDSKDGELTEVKKQP